jgi:hypothetical protein
VGDEHRISGGAEAEGGLLGLVIPFEVFEVGPVLAVAALDGPEAFAHGASGFAVVFPLKAVEDEG